MSAEAAPDLHPITLLDYPVQLWVETKEHVDELLREFTLIVEGAGGITADVEMPQRLVTLVDVLRQQYGGASDEREQRLFAAAAAGVEKLDVALELPVGAAGGARALSTLLDEADDYCREGKHLLTLATPSPLVAFRRWYLEQIATQLEGAAPVAWTDPAPDAARG